MTTPPFRVVLLTKDNHLGRYLEARLAETGLLAAVVHEVRLDAVGERARYAWRTARREGFARTANVMLAEVYEALFRRAELREAQQRILPLPAPNAAPTYERHRVEGLNSESARALLARLQPDLFVVHATGILGPKTYQLARRLAVNIHCGVLPEYRGHASTFWALWNHDYENLGVSVHEIAKIVDTGRVFRLGRVPHEPGDTDFTVWLRAFRVGVDLAVDIARRLARGEELQAVTLDGAPGPHYPRRSFTEYVRYRLGARSPRPVGPRT
jgi:folate-dependent phosphoribosylglycinamide formyltransferase PurN